MVITTILIKRKYKKWYQNRFHLMYLLDDYILIDPTFNGIQYYILSLDMIINNYNLILDGYEIVDTIQIKQRLQYNNFMKLHLYNCISTGKTLIGIKGIYFTCKQFFNKLKRLQNG